MPESVRYLLSRGRVAEAERTVVEIEAKAAEGKPLPPCRPIVPAGVDGTRRHRVRIAHAGAAQAHHPTVDRVVLLPVVVERHNLHAADRS